MDSRSDLFFANRPEPMWVYDLETLRILAVNRAAVARYGYSEEEFLERTIADIRPPEAVPVLGEAVESVTEESDDAGIWRHCTKAGEILEVAITSKAVDFEGRPAEIVVARDASRFLAMDREMASSAALVAAESTGSTGTPEAVLSTRELRDANAELHRGRTRLESAQRLLGLGTWELDVTDRELIFDEGVRELLGLPASSSPRSLHAYFALIHPDDRRRARRRLARFLEGEEDAFSFEHRVVRPDGEVLHVVGGGEILDGSEGRTVTGVVQDVTERVRAREELSVASTLLELAGRVASLGGWRLDVASGESEWTPGMWELHELDPGPKPSIDEAVSFYVEEDRPIILAAFQRCIVQGEPFDEVLRFVGARGTLRWVRAIGEAERDPAGGVVALRGALQDVTELVEARQASRDLEERLRATLDSMPDGFFTLDHEWRFTFVNQEFLRVVGLDESALLGRSHWEIFPQTVDTVFHREYERALETRKAVRFEGAVRDGDLWLSVSAYPTRDGLAVHLRNINERKRIEAALQERLKELRCLYEILSTIADRSLEVEDVCDRIVASLPSGMQHDREAVVRIRLREAEARSPGWATPCQSFSVDIVEGGEAVGELEVGYREQPQRSSEPLFLPEEVEMTETVGAHLGKLIEHRYAASRLAQVDRLRAVGELTGGVAHDFNNLLTVIMGNAELLLDELSNRDDDGLKDLAALTLQSAERGADLTRSLLAFARRQRLQPKKVHLGDITVGLEGLLRRTLTENIELGIVRADDLWLTEIDPGQLETALLNLTLNSRDAMPEGGNLTIAASNVVLDEDYARRHDEVSGGDYVLVSVSDSGEGMPPEVVSRALEPFFTTKEVGDGSGLGLSMVYGFVKQSGGHLKVYSEVGEGTTVRMYFPRSLGEPEEDSPQDRGHLQTGSEHVLVVEDDSLVRRHVVSLIEGLGYQVSSASDGNEALSVLESVPRLDVLFTDMVLPGGLNGRELAEKARAESPGLSVLFTSGYTEDAVVHQRRLDSGSNFVGKPYRREELSAKLRFVLEGESG